MPNCPKCGSRMVLRTARQGGRAGKQFYGCSKFPNCRGTQNVGASRPKSSKPRTTTKSGKPASSKVQSVVESVSSVIPTQPVDPVLRQKVEVAVKGWVESLVDFSRNNNLLFYKDTKTTTLDLEQADPGVLERLLSGDAVSFSELFGRLDLLGTEAENAKKDVSSRIKKIRSKAQENFEERSIGTLSLARGFASWDAPDSDGAGRPPNAPIFIYGLEIRPGKRKDDLTVLISGDPELNPVLQIFLRREFGVDALMPDEELVDGDLDQVENALNLFKLDWAEVPNLQITDKLAISNFSYAKLSMVQDLESGLDDLSNHPLILALAGDQKAQESVRNQVTDIDLGLPNLVNPPNEFLVLDADSSQNEVINAMVAGQSFAFEGPPGTGKSQTIANSIACLVAEGKKVLFVAEKRAAIDAVIRRLSAVGLGDLVMDFHGAGKKRRDVLDELSQTISTVNGVAINVDNDPFLELVDARKTLLQHNEQLFQVHHPWNLSLYDALQYGSRASDDQKVNFRLRLNDLEKITPEVLHQLESKFVDFEQLGGFVRSRIAETWRHASLDSAEEVGQALSALRDIKAGGLGRFGQASESAMELFRIPTKGPDNALKLSQLLADVQEFQDKYGQDTFAAGIEDLHIELQGKHSKLGRALARLFSPSYRRAIKQAKGQLGADVSVSEICTVVARIKILKEIWTELVPQQLQPPVISRSLVLQELLSSWRQVERLREELRGFSDLVITIDTNHDVAMNTAVELLELETFARGMLKSSALRHEFENFGLGQLLAEIENRGIFERTSEMLRYSWGQSLAEQLRSRSSVVAMLNPQGLDQAVKIFCENDVRHIASKPGQIRRIWATKYRGMIANHPKQEQSLLASINRKRKLPGLSKVFSESPDVISALKPCWVMSPLSVSMLRPPSSWFDVVIFDEASQIPPADAMTSIKAAKQMVVAGDSLQLPPTPFFAAGESDSEDPYDDDQYEETSKSADYESILDFIKIIIPRYRQLRWHYRSRDERLIAFSNHKLYKTLIAFPYAGADATLHHVTVPVSEKSKGKGASNLAEVETVVNLVARHSIENPQESLGVIALGFKHSTAIEDALNNARISNRELDDFLSDDHDGEPFFVKNLERVQGDERDAIILSIGYGRNESGQVKYTFGPILGAKGERRLNVATTRAKLRMSSVATFGSGDLDVAKTSKGGAAFLREYLAFVESGGTQLPDKGSTRVEMNPFEQSVHDQLSRRGVKLVPQYGVGNYRLDFAVLNPNKPGSFLLAIECDGRSYHSFPTARERDRLREAALRQRGWEFHRIWSDHWFANPEREVERALVVINAALSSTV